MSGPPLQPSAKLPPANYFASAHDLSQLPPDSAREVAFAGRSNAGKSSAINTLVGRNRLAFVSKTPGRTQLINFFTVGEDRHLVDLPGYGYAKVPEKERRHWGALISGYLAGRRGLVGLVAIMDIRHPLTDLDHQLLDWFLPTGKPVHILLTKSDKLSRQGSLQQLAKVRRALKDLPGVSVQTFSSLSRAGTDEALTLLRAWLALDQPDEDAG